MIRYDDGAEERSHHIRLKQSYNLHFQALLNLPAVWAVYFSQHADVF